MLFTAGALQAAVDTSYTLNYDAATESAPSDGTWNYETGVSGFNFNLTGESLNTSPVTNLGGISQAYHLDGTGGGTKSDLSAYATNSATFELWFKPDDITDADILYETGGTGDGTSFSITDDDGDGEFDDLHFVMKDSGSNAVLTADLSVVLGGSSNITTEFIQAVGVYEKNSGGSTDIVSLYINGQLVTQDSTQTALDDWCGTGDSGLGKDNSGINLSGLSGFPAMTNFEGEVAIFRFYESALGATTIAGNHSAIVGSTGPLAVVNDNATTNLNTAVIVDVLANDTGAGMSVTGVTTASSGTVTNNTSDITYTPNTGFTGSDAFTYTVTDGSGDTGTAIVVVTVSGSSSVLDIQVSTGNDDAEETSTGTMQLSGGDLEIGAKNVGVRFPFNIAPSSNVTSSYIQFRADESDSASVNLSIHAELTLDAAQFSSNNNDISSRTTTTSSVAWSPPAWSSGQQGTGQQTPDLTPLINEVIQQSGWTQGNHIVFILTGDTERVAESYEGGATRAAILHVEMQSNTLPVAADDSVTTNEDIALTIDVLANDSGTNGDDLTIGIITQGKNGSVVNNGTDITYTPNANYNGTDSFSYTVDDGAGGMASATVTVTITSVDDFPVAVNDTATTTEDTAITIDVLVNDTQSDGTLSIDGVTQGSNGTVVNNGNDLTYSPSSGFSGSDSFTYTIIDEDGDTDTATVIVAVNAAAGGPTGPDNSYTLNYDAATESAPSDGNWDDETNVSGFDFSLTGESLITSPVTNIAGITQSFSFDGSGGGATASLSDLPDNPSNASATFELWFKPTDLSDNDVLFETGGGADGIAFVITDDDNDSNFDDLQLAIKDSGFNLTLTADLSALLGGTVNVTSEFIHVIGVYNRNSDGSTDIVSLYINGQLAVQDTAVLVNDWANGGVTGLGKKNGNIITDGISGFPSMTGFEGEIAIFRFYESVFDQSAVTANHQAVNYVPNSSPVAVNDSSTTNADTAVTIDVLANDTDADNNTLSVGLVTHGEHGSVVNNSGTDVTYTPDTGYQGTDTFTYTVEDGAGGVAIATVTVDVVMPPQPPVANDDSASTDEEVAVVVDVLANDTDANNDTLEVTGVTQGNNGSVGYTTTNVTYTPAAAYFGPDSFTYTISDGNGGTDTGTVNITVNNLDRQPVFTSTPVTSIIIGNQYTYDVDATDADNDTLTYSLTQAPTGMTINASTGVIGWFADDNGNQNVAVSVSDGITTAVEQSYVLDVDMAAAPTGLSISGSNPNTTGTYTVSWNAVTGADNYMLQEKFNSGSWSTIQTSPLTNITVLNKPTGEWKYRVRACFGGSTSSSQCTSYTANQIVDLETTPIITSSPVTSVHTSSDYFYNVEGWDPQGDNLTYSLTNKPAGMVINPNNGLISWDDPAYGDHTVTVQVSDGSDTGSQTYTLSVLNESPVISSSAITSINLGSAYYYDVQATDAEFATLTYSLTQKPTGMTISNTGLISWSTPTAGNHSVIVSVDDGISTAATQSFTLNVVIPVPDDLAIIGADPNPTGDYKVKWNSVSGAASYKLEEKLNSGSWSVLQDTSATSIDVSGRSVGTWKYRVSACENSTCSAVTSTQTVDVIIPDSDPQADEDGDGVRNGLLYIPTRVASTTVILAISDNCPTVTNSDQLDTDGDAAGDACDTDDDGDEVADVDDAFPLDATEWADNDNDGIGDNADTDDDNDGTPDSSDAFPFNAAENADADADGIGDGADNCVNDHNPYQADNDEDGIGDACDTHDGTQSPPPAIPANLSISTGATNLTGDYTVDWDTVVDATTYPLEESSDGVNWITLQATGANSYNVTNQADGTWYYRVKACNASLQCSLLSGVVSVHVTGPYSDDDGDGVRHGPLFIPTRVKTTTVILAVSDNCPLVPNSDQLNSDGLNDGGNACDDNDDEDLHLDAQDNCPTVPNDGQEDLDGDGEGDVCDSDIDGDDVDNTLDNCPNIANSNQQNSDADIYGDACDAFPTDSTEWLDSDGDGVGDNSDPDPLDPTITGDFDGDGIDNSVDPFPNGFDGVPSAPAPHVETAPAANSAEVIETDKVGTVAGTFRVDESGAATYSIPIATVAGTAGVVPQISLNYSSQSGNGLMGIGWHIGGLSAISRCRQTLGQDGVARAIAWDKEDRFCLDGQRLIFENSNAPGTEYGDPDTTYRTEIDSFAVVTAKGGTAGAGAPDYFIVERKDGSTSYYGNTADSKLADGSDTLTWAINEFNDSVGNPIEFEYLDDVDGHRISRIRYAYGAGSTSNTYIEFNYGNRDDEISGYVGGSVFITHKRLTTISSYNEGTSIRQYNLSYDEFTPAFTTDDLSRLTSIEECVGTRCLPKTTFDWALPTPGIESASTSFVVGNGDDYVLSDYKPADINGDGILDLIWMEVMAAGSDTNHLLHYAISDGSTLTPTNFDGGAAYITYPQDFDEKVILKVFDYNADGRQDLAVWAETGPGLVGDWEIYLSTPQLDNTWKLKREPASEIDFPFTSPAVRFGDVNADGLPDATVHDGYTYTRHLLVQDPTQTANTGSHRYYHFEPAGQTITLPDFSSPAASDSNTIFVSSISGDFNGDGLVDGILKNTDTIFSSTDITYHVVVASGNGYETYATGADNPLVIEGGGPTTFSYLKENRIVDLNGDGLSDVLWTAYSNTDQYTWYYALSTGAGFSSRQEILTEADNPNTDEHEDAMKQLQLVDYNNDGYPDLIRLHPTETTNQLKAYLWDPQTNTFAAPINIRTADQEDNHALFDFTGDGVADYVRYDPEDGTSNEKFYFHQSSNNGERNVVTRITNGLGAETNITFEALNTTANYTRVDPAFSTVVEQCWPGYGSWGPVCYDIVASDYTHFNDPFANLPAESQTLQPELTAPVLELNGPMYVVTRVTSSAPATSSSSATVDYNATSAISYFYGEAKIQAAGRGMLGFKKLSTIDEQTGVSTTTTYRQDFPFIGYPWKTEVRTAANHLLSESINTWELKNYDSVNPGNTPKPYRPYIGKSVEKTRDLVANGATEGGLITTVTTTNTYDDFGNPTEIKVETSGDAESHDGSPAVTKNFRKTTTNIYGTTTWDKEKGRLTRTTVKSERDEDDNGIYEINNVNDPRVSEFTYYTAADGALEGLLKTETIEPDVTQFKLETTYHYDSFGNKIKAVVTGGGETRCDVQTAVYDTKGRYIDESYDCLGNKTSEVISRNEYGQPLEVDTYIDTNGINAVTTTYAYSDRGIQYFETNSTGAYTTTTLANCPGAEWCPLGAAYITKTIVAGGGESQEAFDVLGRSIHVRTKGFGGQWINARKKYDSLGRLSYQSEPYFGGAPTTYWTEFKYDLLGRVTRTVLPDYQSGVNESDIDVTYTGLRTETVNAEGYKRTEYKNVLGDVIWVKDNEDGVVEYAYDAQGNLKTTTLKGSAAEPHNIVTTINYDKLGRKENMTDPDKGYWVYEYNHFGELTKQTDARLQYSEMTYDGVGRLETRKDYHADDTLEGDAQWFYDSAPNGLGQLSSVTDYNSGYNKSITYDNQGRPSKTTTALGQDGDHYERVTYDQFGRTFQVFDAARQTQSWDENVVESQYNAYGYQHKLADGVHVNGAPAKVYQTITAMDARGNITQEDLGNGATTNRVFEESTGRIKTIDASITGLQDLQYEWDILGNLKHRIDKSGGKDFKETFSYDTMNRLRFYTVTDESIGGAQVSNNEVRYDVLGNITHKSDVGDYDYAYENISGCTQFAAPHAVNCAGGVTYNYDANGNNTSSSDGRTISYTIFDKASSISKGTHVTDFEYGPNRSRYKRTDTDTNGTETTLYLGSVEKITRANGDYEEKRYIGGIAIETTKNSQAPKLTYIYRDHLGSIDIITNDAGVVLQAFSFDPWGQRRNATTWAALTGTDLTGFDTSLTTRGFTGHEMVDAVGIIHMNGRIYDPKLGRFLQADPFIPDVLNTQAFNRYSYVFNNPLNLTDPGGYNPVAVFAAAAVGGFLASKVALELNVPILSSLVNIASCATLGPACAAGFAFGSTLGFGGSFGDALKAGLLAGASAFAFEKIGGFLDDKFGVTKGTGFLGTNLSSTGYVAKIAIHSVAGGVLAELQGGKFGHGFASAGIVAAASPLLAEVSGPTINDLDIVEVAVAAVIGGTASSLTGGKFANGAVTGAFQNAFNQQRSEKEARRRRLGTDWESLVDAFNENAAEFFGPLSGSAEDAVDYYINQGGFLGGVGGTIAGTVTSNRIGNTLAIFGTGYIAGALFSLTQAGQQAIYGVGQWLRLGPSYDKINKVDTYFSIRWGAGRKHWKKIGSPTLRKFNRWLRKQGPGEGGHWHIWRKKKLD